MYFPNLVTICHNDMDSKNVLWSGSDCRIIDLEWLEYNIKRALGMDCAAEEIELGVSEVRNTIAHIVYYHEAKEDILGCLNQLKIGE